MPTTVANEPMSVRPPQTRRLARTRSLLCVLACVFAVVAPTTCFLRLTLTSNLRIAEEHETHAQVSTRQLLPQEQDRRSDRRPVAITVATREPSLYDFTGCLGSRGHALANGLRAPLRC